MQVTKATGDKEPFDEQKLKVSINRAGIPKDIQELVVDDVKKHLYEGVPTSEIYNRILQFLGNSKEPFAKTKYGLKQAIMDLGPTGYPFEDFVAKLLNTQGWETEVRVQMEGICVTHEVDLLVQQGGKRSMVEAKFHNRAGTKTKIHVALYTKARFEDLVAKYNLSQAWIITNTKVTLDVIEYARCTGMRVISWSYPQGESLRDIIESSGLSPITMLSSLSMAQKQTLLAQHMVLCKDMIANPPILDILHLDPDKKKRVLSEASFITQSR